MGTNQCASFREVAEVKGNFQGHAIGYLPTHPEWSNIYTAEAHILSLPLNICTILGKLPKLSKENGDGINNTD